MCCWACGGSHALARCGEDVGMLRMLGWVLSDGMHMRLLAAHCSTFSCAFGVHVHAPLHAQLAHRTAAVEFAAEVLSLSQSLFDDPHAKVTVTILPTV